MIKEELKELKGKLGMYEYVLNFLRGEAFKYPPNCPQEKALSATIRMVENQKRMVEFAIYSREKAT